ncbi:hypothetical protein CEXT_133051 [Caerostris extrusa]|uniref:Uncharacterized protein n=1 Tax=Caerostris extrusa TaxID=172846 RepID=A0AAV4XPV3_CAEEX|nr:hypothetical protein CEXT_133051 [Caerostris extrusa]
MVPFLFLVGLIHLPLTGEIQHPEISHSADGIRKMASRPKRGGEKYKVSRRISEIKSSAFVVIDNRCCDINHRISERAREKNFTQDLFLEFEGFFSFSTFIPYLVAFFLHCTLYIPTSA